MKLQLYIIILLLTVGCKEQPNQSNAKKGIVPDEKVLEITEETQQKDDPLIKSLAELRLDKESQNYEAVKRAIEKDRIQLHAKDLKQDSLSKVFEVSLLNKILPFWEGTAWSFEGHTSKPTSGTIACGYFVSTTLQDIGLNVNRYKLAQQSPINEARSLAINTVVKVFSEGSNAQNIASINKYLEEGIHFIGFDQNHVGYILKKKDNLYLIHSNYLDARGVEIEEIEKSKVFKSYSKFYIVELSTNEDLLQHWINQQQIKIKT